MKAAFHPRELLGLHLPPATSAAAGLSGVWSDCQAALCFMGVLMPKEHSSSEDWDLLDSSAGYSPGPGAHSLHITVLREVHLGPASLVLKLFLK